MKGEFENRLRQVIDEVQASPKPIILFIDEAHTLIGAGGAAGTGDAANLLKPALARGTLRTIAATTWAEYKKYIEKDPALTRRFQVVQVAEPSEEKAILMVRGVASMLEKHHRVQVLDEALEAAVRLSHRYIPGAAAAGQGGQPARHRVRARGDQPARRAAAARGLPPDDRGAADRARDHRPRRGGRHRRRRAPQASCEEKLAADEERGASSSKQRWKAERELVDRILEIRAKLRQGSEPVEGTGSKLEQAARSAEGGRRAPPAATPLTAGGARDAARRARRAPGASSRRCRASRR